MSSSASKAVSRIQFVNPVLFPGHAVAAGKFNSKLRYDMESKSSNAISIELDKGVFVIRHEKDPTEVRVPHNQALWYVLK